MTGGDVRMSTDRGNRLYPSPFYNVITLIGAGLALFGLAASTILYIMNGLSVEGGNPYMGIFILLVFPTVLVFGLLLIPVGSWLEKKRRERGQGRPLVVNLGDARHRNAIVTFVAGTCLFLLVTTIGLYQTFHYTESVQFCGDVCHTVMEPEKTAYLNSPHARVACVNCHIGPGADWYVRSKLSGLRQVYKVATNTYPTPIETPIHDLRPAQDLCEGCHWPEKFHATGQFTRDHYLGDRENTHWRIDLLVNVGGTSASPEGRASGAHWHVDPDNKVTYVASDSSRQGIEAVIVSKPGSTMTYTPGGTPLSDSVLAQKRSRGLVRTMDCMDCHNRPSHIYLSPMEGVNAAMTSGRLDRNVPFIKRQAVEALSKVYATPEGARDSIALSLTGFYREQGITLPDGVVQAVQEVYAQNMFPKMKVRWDRYPNDIGHFFFPGCSRCHGSDLATPEGRTISSDCSNCHTIMAQGVVQNGQAPTDFQGKFKHPIDIGGAEQTMRCFDCHSGDGSIYLMASE
jgi:nitrate/TMAO reductase-like tetraheme cytochrome c subunit